MNTTLNKNSLAALNHIITNGTNDAPESHWKGVNRDISQIGDYFVLREEGDIVEIAEADSVEDYLQMWDINGHDYCELCAEFGVTLSDADKGAVEEDYQAAVKIWIDHHYYAGTCNAPTDGWMRDNDGDAFIFASYAEAREHIDKLEGGMYHLAHGEHARPDYTICEA
jgi:hypothetical protein